MLTLMMCAFENIITCRVLHRVIKFNESFYLVFLWKFSCIMKTGFSYYCHKYPVFWSHGFHRFLFHLTKPMHYYHMLDWLLKPRSILIIMWWLYECYERRSYLCSIRSFIYRDHLLFNCSHRLVLYCFEWISLLQVIP